MYFSANIVISSEIVGMRFQIEISLECFHPIPALPHTLESKRPKKKMYPTCKQVCGIRRRVHLYGFQASGSLPPRNVLYRNYCDAKEPVPPKDAEDETPPESMQRSDIESLPEIGVQANEKVNNPLADMGDATSSILGKQTSQVRLEKDDIPYTQKRKNSF